MIPSTGRRNDRENRRRRCLRGLVHTLGTPFLRHLRGAPKTRLRSGATPPGADKDASHLFQSSAPSGAAPERTLITLLLVVEEDGWATGILVVAERER